MDLPQRQASGPGSVEVFFEEGGREAVTELLGYYQNEDGGFGRCLEPDSWNPESAPYTVLHAIGILRSIDGVDTNSPIVGGMLRYLESGVHFSCNKWHFSIPSNDRFAHAPWWTYSEETNAIQDFGITAGLSGFLLRYANRESEGFSIASQCADRILRRFGETKDFGEMGAGGLWLLVQDLEAAGLSSRFDCSAVKGKMKQMVDDSIERDPEKWQFYTPRPSEFISSPDSPFYAGNEEIVEKELDYLIETRNPGGVWNITWTWFDLGERYAKEFAVSENWWMSMKAIDKVRFLKNFGRL